MKLLWTSDLHFNFLTPARQEKLFEDVNNSGASAFLIAGDIATSKSIIDVLDRMSKGIKVPIYFVLGNHDYYNGSIIETEVRITKFCEEFKNLIPLFAVDGPISLSPAVGLVGINGAFGDFGYGNKDTTVELTDFTAIEELRITGKEKRIPVLHNFASMHAYSAKKKLEYAVSDGFEHIILLMHVPPFDAASWYKGQQSSPDFLPYFSNKKIGESIKNVAEDNPNVKFTVLCGHTHGHGSVRVLSNLRIITCGSDYRYPSLYILNPENEK